jgi:hypothetical protein
MSRHKPYACLKDYLETAIDDIPKITSSKYGSFMTKTLLAGWVLCGFALGVVWFQLLQYESMPADPGKVVSHWPQNTSISRSSERPTLLVFAHPRCPCTRATLEELGAVLRQAGHEVAVHVLFTRPGGVHTAAWEETDTVRFARELPGSVVQWDEDGIEAMHFGARASGHVMLFTASGSLLFNGGVTIRRGHLGDNGYSDALVQRLSRATTSPVSTPVFGCALVHIE